MAVPALPDISRAAEALFETVEHAWQSNAEISDEHLLALNFLCGKNFQKALTIVDSLSVKCFAGERSGRKVYQIQSKSSHEVYTVHPAHYCSCQAFYYEVVCRSEAPYCKHQIAARIAAATGRCTTTTVLDTLIAKLLFI